MRKLNRLPRWLRRWIEKRRAYWSEIRLENWAAGVDLREWARGYSEANGWPAK